MVSVLCTPSALACSLLPCHGCPAQLPCPSLRHALCLTLPPALPLARCAHLPLAAALCLRAAPPLPCPLLRLQSGIDISDELLKLYDSLKLKKAHKYITFTLEKTGTAAGKDVYGWSIKERGEPSPDDTNAEVFKAVVKSLPEAEPRFVVFDFTESKEDGRLIKKRACG